MLRILWLPPRCTRGVSILRIRPPLGNFSKLMAIRKFIWKVVVPTNTLVKLTSISMCSVISLLLMAQHVWISLPRNWECYARHFLSIKMVLLLLPLYLPAHSAWIWLSMWNICGAGARNLSNATSSLLILLKYWMDHMPISKRMLIRKLQVLVKCEKMFRISWLPVYVSYCASFITKTQCC